MGGVRGWDGEGVVRGWGEGVGVGIGVRWWCEGESWEGYGCGI